MMAFYNNNFNSMYLLFVPLLDGCLSSGICHIVPICFISQLKTRIENGATRSYETWFYPSAFRIPPSAFPIPHSLIPHSFALPLERCVFWLEKNLNSLTAATFVTMNMNRFILYRMGYSSSGIINSERDSSTKNRLVADWLGWFMAEYYRLRDFMGFDILIL